MKTSHISKRIIIVCQHGYSGGIIALSVLCKLLIEKNIDARLFYIGKKPRKGENMLKYWFNWLVNKMRSYYYPIIIKYSRNKRRVDACQKFLLSPLNGLPVQRLPFFSKNNSIVVYPDSVYGNFLHARNVVRYFLYYNPFPDDNEAYGENDLFISYREVFVDKNVNPKGNLLTLYHFDSSLYYCYNKSERNGNCYIVRKGRSRTDLPSEFDGPIIDNLSEEEKVKIFNECKYCYCYDLQTFYSQIAAVCGCISIVVLEPGKQVEDYYSSDEISNHPGVAFGNTSEEIKHALETMDDLRKQLDFSEHNNEQVNNFINLLNNQFG